LVRIKSSLLHSNIVLGISSNFGEHGGKHTNFFLRFLCHDFSRALLQRRMKHQG